MRWPATDASSGDTAGLNSPSGDLAGTGAPSRYLVDTGYSSGDAEGTDVPFGVLAGVGGPCVGLKAKGVKTYSLIIFIGGLLTLSQVCIIVVKELCFGLLLCVFFLFLPLWLLPLTLSGSLLCGTDLWLIVSVYIA